MSGWKNAGNRVSTVLGRKLGGELMRLRVASGKSRPDAAKVLSAHQTKLVKMESGWVPMRDPDIRALCDLYGLTDQSEVEELLALAKLDRERRKAKGWWRFVSGENPLWEYIAMEDAATRIRTWELSFIPGLFQTAEYTRALVIGHGDWEDPAEVEPIVEVRQKRQQRIHGENPLELYVLVWEAALRQLVGGPEVMRRQLAHVMEVAELPHIRLQVLPFRAGSHPCAVGPFHILSFAESGAIDVVYTDSHSDIVVVENEAESARCRTYFERTARLSMSQHDSLRLIDDIRKEI
ncbi:helix-turn-helix domain-containing protein [Streptomyces sp. NPDC059853]|uniref:helix-turn-helix domain-containing protein n=1 Tax=Streptomyces sp. NPDC059853 TaxID=3346973 RepID=UPI0036547871